MTERPAANDPLAGASLWTATRDGGWLLLWIVALALVLRLIKVDLQLWLDEVLMLGDLVRLPFGEMIRSYKTDNQHPLYTLLAWCMARLFGEHAWSLRLPAVLFGIASVAAMFGFVRRYASRGEAAFVAAMLALSSNHIWFSQDARAYTALMFFSILSVARFRDLWDGRRDAIGWYALWTGLAAWSHLTGAFLAIGAFPLWIVGRLRGRTSFVPLGGLVLAGVVTLALHAPMLADMWWFFAARPDRVAVASEWKSPLWTLVAMAQGLGATKLPLAIVGGLLVLWPFIAGARDLARRYAGLAGAMLMPGVAGAVITLGLGRHLWPRFFFFVAGFGLWILVRGVRVLHASWSARRRADAPSSLRRERLAAAIVLLGLAATAPLAWRTKQDFESPRDYVRAHQSGGEVVLTAGLATWPYQYLYAPDFQPVQAAAELGPHLTGTSRPWLIYASEVFLRAYRPEVWALIQRDFDVIQVWPSSVGEVVVCRRR